MGSINNLTSSYLQSAVASALQTAGLKNNANQSLLNGISTSSLTPGDNGQLSPLAQVLSTLQQLQQSNPTEYQQITAQIATNLQTAAQSAQSSGNTTAANQLNQLATDFTTASQTGQLPNIQDLAQALGGHHHHHHGHGGSGSSTDTDSDTSSTASTSTSGATAPSTTPLTSILSENQILANFLSSGSQNTGFDAGAIILNTLASAGLTGTTGA
jgi:hypothetical protein